MVRIMFSGRGEGAGGGRGGCRLGGGIFCFGFETLYVRARKMCGIEKFRRRVRQSSIGIKKGYRRRKRSEFFFKYVRCVDPTKVDLACKFVCVCGGVLIFA